MKKGAEITSKKQRLPQINETEAKYSPMLNGNATNKVTKISEKKNPARLDAYTGAATFTDSDFSLIIQKYTQLSCGFRTSTKKLLDALTIRLSEQNHYKGGGEPNLNAVISLEKYMSLCGKPLTKSSIDKTRKIVKEDLEILFNMSIDFSDKINGKTAHFTQMRILQAIGMKNGDIAVTFSTQLANYLINSYIMQYPIALFRLDTRNANVYSMGKKLALHASIENNRKRNTFDIISVKSLMQDAPEIPSFEEVMNADRHLELRIITPFEKTLNLLMENNIIFEWHYCNAKKEVLTDEQLKKMDYKVFIKLYITFTMSNYPSNVR
ncbi:hypothetical protein AGMMS49975_00200 [Clostridia bacterium]|nr:hypothetical protein AGMMS49975_00200 [Clostridia bacterium]